MKRERAVSRREAIGLMSVATTALALGCGGDSPTSPSSVSSPPTTTATPPAASGACVVAPSETVGPYPSLSNLVRSDIRDGRTGTPVTLALTIVNTNSACAGVAGAMVDIWQCDAEGHYSQYTQPGYDGRSASFLRGIQTTDASGRATFITIYPGWYQGRATHIHVEVSVNGRAVKVTQIAFPENVSAEVYRTGVYAAHGQNPQSNASDMVFADSLASELPTISGDPAGGYNVAFTVGVAV